MARSKSKRIPCLLWPLWALFRLLALIVEMTGRLAGAVLGMAFIVAGALASLTIVGAVVGIPLALFGLMLLLRSLF